LQKILPDRFITLTCRHFQTTAVGGRFPQIRYIYLEAESLKEGLQFDPGVLPPLPVKRKEYG
jgi:hypothetical protein